MAEKLTVQQACAVNDRGGKLLVSAAAGSGKTKVLVDRLMSYMTDSHDPTNLDDFLIITYTKAAAAELRGKISDKLAGLNVARFTEWQPDFTLENARQAILAFKGDVYTGLDAETLSAEDFKYAQQHLRILSGMMIFRHQCFGSNTRSSLSL